MERKSDMDRLRTENCSSLVHGPAGVRLQSQV